MYLTAVGEGELLTKISVPTRKPGTGDAMAGVTLGCARDLHRERGSDRRPRRASGRDRLRLVGAACARAAMEQRLAGGDLSEAAPSAPRRTASARALDPPSDVHASADYRRHLAEVSAVRAVLQAAERAKG